MAVEYPEDISLICGLDINLLIYPLDLGSSRMWLPVRSYYTIA